MEKISIRELIHISKEIRKDIAIMTSEAGGGHLASSFSIVEILVSLYYSELKNDPVNPYWLERDRFVLSKGHAAPALYAVLAEKGYFPISEIKTLRKIGSRLQGHPKFNKLPGLETTSGSLGQGLSTAVGMALAAKMDNKSSRIFVLIGDGECQEGQIWEAAMAAAHYKLDNLIVIVDKNDLQSSASTDKIMSLGDLSAKWSSFGWKVFNGEGHDFNDLFKIYTSMKSVKHKPIAILAHTIKGCGVPFTEGNLSYHSVPLNGNELDLALQHLNTE